MAKHFLGSILLTVLVSSASAAGAASSSSSSGSTDYCKTKDSCYYEDAMDLCVDERYVPIYDDVDLCDTDEHDEPTYDGPTECQAEELDLCDDDKETKTYAGCTSEYVFNKAIKDFMKSKPTDPTAKSIKDSLPMLMGSDVFDYTGGEPVPDEKLAMAEGMIKGAGDIFANMGLMRKCGEEEPETEKKVVAKVVKKVLGNVIYGNLEMKLDGSRNDAEDAATSVLASALQVPEAAIIKANLVRVTGGGRRLQDQSSDLPTYRLQYEVAVPPGQTAELLLAKANNLPQTLPAKFAEYGVKVTDVVNLTPPLTLTRNHGLFLATTTTLTPITETMTWLQIVSRAVLLIIPCFAGYLGSIPGFEQKFCCK